MAAVSNAEVAGSNQPEQRSVSVRQGRGFEPELGHACFSETHKFRTNRTNDLRGLHVPHKQRFVESASRVGTTQFFCEDPSSILVSATRIFVLDVDRMAFFCGVRIYMYIRPPTSGAATHITRHILPRRTTHGRGFPPIVTAGSVLDRPAAEKQLGFLGFFPSRKSYYYYYYD